MTRPLVGLTTYREVATWGAWTATADLLHAEYADTVGVAGGVPVLLPTAMPADALDDAAASVVARLDALVIAGGADVDPANYGAQPHPRTTACRPERDAWEIALVRAADAVGLPLLGICRGMQLLAVAAGGSLVQHVPDVVGDDRHSPGADVFGDMPITTTPGSRVAAAVGPSVTGQCHHHQIVGAHPGYEATAVAADGTLEAMERPGDRFCVAVQWHPEMSHDQRLFAALVAAT